MELDTVLVARLAACRRVEAGRATRQTLGVAADVTFRRKGEAQAFDWRSLKGGRSARRRAAWLGFGLG